MAAHGQQPKEQTTINHLCLDIHLKICSYLSLTELANCRLVSHSLKLWAEKSLEYITRLHLQVIPSQLKDDVQEERWVDWDEAVAKHMNESYVQAIFLSKPFVTVQVRGGRSNEVDSTFYSFLGKLCPNLQVLRMEDVNFTGENLSLLASKLQFFTCREFCIPQWSLWTTLQFYFGQFPNLQGFSCPNSPRMGLEVFDSFVGYRFQLNRSICRIQTALLNEETFELPSREGTKCLYLFRDLSGPPSPSLPHSLAESLVELTIDFAPTVKFCPFALPNLLYLTVTRRPEWPTDVANSDAFVSAPKLRSFIFAGEHNLDQFINFIQSSQELRILRVDHSKSNPDLPRKKPSISLPPNVEMLSLRMCQPLELVKHSLTPLKYVAVDQIVPVSLMCPDLKVLICYELFLSPKSQRQLLHSLPKCTKLTKLRIRCLFIHEFVSLQPLIDSLSDITCLSHLKLSVMHHSPPDSIHLKQQKFPSLDTLRLDLPFTDVYLYLASSFTCLQLERFKNFLMLRGPNKDYCVDANRVVASSDDEKLDKLIKMSIA